jgi:phosphoribosylformylglycinamidine (FGAM) synthase-like enzyme
MTRDTYSAGQAGAMGLGAHAHDMTFQQIWNQTKDDLDLSALVAGLSQLRQAMREQEVSAEHDIAIGEVAAVEAAAAGEA